MVNAQEFAHAEGHDYTAGSPHLKHARLRRCVEYSLRDEVRRLLDAYGTCRVLEVGAGHGSFTDVIRNAGANVTVTEMSRASASRLEKRFHGKPDVRVIYDPQGVWCRTATEPFNLVVSISVLHHIPDYLAAVASYAMLTAPGGTFLSWQDPLWYARLPKIARVASQAAYLVWRAGQGNLSRGFATQVRRFSGVLDESNPADMSEYHVVRGGVDEDALQSLLESLFVETTIARYWSTQSSLLHRAGDRMGLVNSFSLRARGRFENRVEHASTGASASALA